MTLLPTMKMRLAAPAALIDLSKIPRLSGITVDGGSLTIGAMTRMPMSRVRNWFAAAIPLLAGLAAGIGDPAGSQSRHDRRIDRQRRSFGGLSGRGAWRLARRSSPTVGRSPPTLLPALFETALEPGEIITALRFPVPSAGGYAKFKSPASRYAVVGVFVAKKAGKVRVAVTGAGPGVFRVAAMEAALERAFTPDAVAAIKLDAEDLSSDIHADAEYRAHLVTVMAKKAVMSALQAS